MPKASKSKVNSTAGEKSEKKAKGAEAKSPGQRLADKLFFSLKNCWEGIDAQTDKEINTFAKSYREMLNRGKTEREFSTAAVELLKKHGFRELKQLKAASSASPRKAADRPFPPGTKVFEHIRGKALVAAIIGKKPLEEGINMLGAHVDSPRIDLKQYPLYEDVDFAFLDTHYYGGIKKYQWTAMPLAMHGVFFDSEGKQINVSIGEDEDDPVFVITDLLPHLAQEQMQKKAAELIEGEDLDILAGSRPYNDEKVKEKVKLHFLSVLHEKYGINEKSFASAEIEFVPAFKAKDLGLDRSMIGGYGHDDRCCAYTALRALLELGGSPPERTILCYLSDKEEIGSFGNTGAYSHGFENFVAAIAGEDKLRPCFSNSSMLSADVSAAVDPSYINVFDKKNSSYMGKGLVINKYTGSRGKSGASDANAEFCSRVISMLTQNKIPWQFGEFGKVDKGGGGTIALHAAKYGIEVLDCGIPVLSMHSPFEVISKIDLYLAYKGYTAFLKDM